MVSPCQTQTGPNETQTNLLTGFVSLQTDISWQPERNICENEILDPHVTGRLSYGRESTSVLRRNIFRSRSKNFRSKSQAAAAASGAFSQGACRASLQEAAGDLRILNQGGFFVL